MTYESKPNKNSFLVYRFLWSLFGLFLFFIFLGLGVAAFTQISFWWFLIPIPFLAWWSWFKKSVRFKKESYQFEEDRIISKYGTWISDGKTELLLKNITHVKMRLPWLEHKLFKTGSISIQSAGSGLSEVTLRHMDKPEEFFQYVRKLMQRKGFKLAQKKLIQKEIPNSIGILLETGGIGLIYFIVLVIVLSFAIPGLVLAYNANLFSSVTGVLFILLSFLIFLFAFGWSGAGVVLHYLDAKRRTYYLYEDTVTYHEGFLTKHDAFIPVENIADSETTQMIVSRILGLYDVKISCQGSGQEIYFSNMENGDKFSKNLDTVVEKDRTTRKTSSPKKISKRIKQKKARAADTKYTTTLKMDAKRYFAPIVALALIFFVGIWFTLPFGMKVFGFALASIPILLFILAGAAVGGIIQIYANTWDVKANSVKQKVDFINKQETEFSNEKIMGVKVKRDPFDRWFNTVTLDFWSIGSSVSISAKGVLESSELVPGILGKIGVFNDKPIQTVKSKYTIGRHMLRHYFTAFFILPIAIIAAVVIAVLNPILWLVVLLLAIGLILRLIYLSLFYDRMRLEIHEDYIMMTKGWLWRVEFYAPLENIKDLSSIKVPFISYGDLKFNVAGEHLQGQGDKQVLVSNSFKFQYMEDVFEKHKSLDTVLASRDGRKYGKNEAGEPSIHVKQCLSNSLPGALIGALFLGCIFFIGGLALGHALHANDAHTLGTVIEISGMVLGILVFLLILISTTVLIKVRRYGLDKLRAYSTGGLIRKWMKSVTFPRIDHINQQQGLFNKLFNNGTVTIHTAGTSALQGPELSVVNVKEFQDYYSKLKRAYSD